MRHARRWWMNGTRSDLLRTSSGLWRRLIVFIRDGKKILGSIILVTICCDTFVTQEANIHFSSGFENLLKFTSHRWYRHLRGCCLFSFCNKANCAFKTPTNASPAPNFCSNLGISAFSKSISETIDLLLNIDYWIPSLTRWNLTISFAIKSNLVFMGFLRAWSSWFEVDSRCYQHSRAHRQLDNGLMCCCRRKKSLGTYYTIANHAGYLAS